MVLPTAEGSIATGLSLVPGTESRQYHSKIEVSLLPLCP